MSRLFKVDKKKKKKQHKTVFSICFKNAEKKRLEGPRGSSQ